MKTKIVGLLILGTVLCARSFSQDVKFATTSDEISKSLSFSDEKKTVDGKEYQTENGKLYQIVNGIKVKAKGLSKVAKMELAPRVAVPIEFEFNKAIVTEKSQSLVSELGKALQSPELKGIRFRIEGHTDSIGADEANMKLSTERAEEIRRILTEQFGVSIDSLETVGYGKSQPIADNTSEEGRQKNRRVQVVRVID